MRSSFLFRTSIVAPLCLGILLATCAEPSWGKEKSKTPRIMDLTDSVLSNRILTNFAALLRASDLESFYSSRGPFTLFAPTDSAFSKLPPGAVQFLLKPENKETLQRIVLFHLVNGKSLDSKDLIPLKTLLSCEGSPLPLHVSHSGAQTVLRARILHADIRCLNGLLDEVDTVLLPPGVSADSLSPPVAAATDTNSVANPAAPPASANSADASPNGITNAPTDLSPPAAASTNAAP